MSARTRIQRLREANPAAAELAAACGLAARVEPDLLRRLRLLIPRAGADAEADLWFSDLLAGRDATAIALDPAVAELLRAGLRDRHRIALREAAAAEIATRHAGAHWSIRLEERIHYLDAARPPGCDEEIDDLLLAALDALRTEPDPRGIARWLLGAAGRLPGQAGRSTAGRASAAAAALHLDRQAPPAGLLTAGESQAWLPWLARSLPQVPVGVQLLDGAVILGAEGPDTELIPDVPDTDPLVIEVRWNDGTRTVSQRVRFRPGEPSHVETGTRAVTLTTLTGASYELAADQAITAGLNFDHRKATLRPCLAREGELAYLLNRSEPAWTLISGRPGSGTSTLMLAAADGSGAAVIEHFFTDDRLTGLDAPRVVEQSCITQLLARYPEFAKGPVPPTLTQVLEWLADRGAFKRRPLVIMLDGLGVGPDGVSVLARLPFPATVPPGVRYLITTSASRETDKHLRTLELTEMRLDRANDRPVCRAMLDRDRDELERVYIGPLDDLVDLADDLPGKLARILDWIKTQPPASVTAETIPVVLTKRWAEWRRAEFGDATDTFLDVLRAAHGRHTWRDCEDAVPRFWLEFWDSCLAVNLVADTTPDGIVELTVPADNELLAPDRPGDRLLGVREDTPAEFARTASPTRLAAAVGHALAIDEVGDAHRLVTDMAVLRRRYAQDLPGLLADLDAVAAALTDADAFAITEGSDPEPLAPGVQTLRQVVAGMAKDGISPAAFAAVLHDRLAELGALLAITRDRGAMPPLWVRRVWDEPELDVSGLTRKIAGPVLAIYPQPDGADPGLIRPLGIASLDGTNLGAPWTGFIGAARGRSGGFVAWSSSELWTEDGETITFDGPIDHAVRLGDGVAVAGPDGTVTLVNRGKRISGRGAPVTDILAGPDGDVIAAYMDGTIRRSADSRAYSGHRGAVRCLAPDTTDTFLSGGDDGCLLLWRYDDPTHPVARWQFESAITCLSSITLGRADGRVHRWDASGETWTVVGDHDSPVRGIALTPQGAVMSWAESVRFWESGVATGFPGGVRDVIVGNETYTVLCGDGSLQQRSRPRPVADRPERTCLAVHDRTVYTGLDSNLIQVSPDGTRATVSEAGPFVQAVMTDVGVVVRDPDDRFVELSPSGEILSQGTAAHILAPFPGGTYLRRVSKDVISLTTTPDYALIEGLSNGDTRAGERVLPGDGSPVTAVAGLPDGHVLTGTEAGDIRCWPLEPERGPVRFPRRDGAIMGMVVVDPWLITAGRDGIVVLWATDPLRPVHEIDLRAPVLALAAEPGLVAARDANGRLWTFELETPLDLIPGGQLSARVVVYSDEEHALRLEDPSSDPYELTAVRISVDGQPATLTPAGPWPAVEPDGTLTVPARPLPDHPLEFPYRPSRGTMPSFGVEVDAVAHYARGYCTTLQIAGRLPPSRPWPDG